jgi:TolA-binding protein
MRHHFLFLAAMLFLAPSLAGSAPAVSVLPPEPASLARLLDARRAQPFRDVATILAEIRQLEVVKASGPVDLVTLRNLGDAYAALERAYIAENKPTEAAAARQRSIASYVQFIPLFPNAPQLGDVRYNLGLEYVASEDALHAREAWAPIVAGTREPLGGQASFLTGETWLEAGKTTPGALKTAIASYEAAYARLPANNALKPWALLRLGTAQEAFGAKSAAQTTWDTLRRDFPTSDAASEIPKGPASTTKAQGK